MLLYDVVKAASTSVTITRTEQDIAAYAVTEMVELMEEIIIYQGRSYKQPGKDGVVGEAVDVIVCMLDLIHKHAPHLTEADLAKIAQKKCDKWIATAEERRKGTA